jgi:hypothetical protein
MRYLIAADTRGEMVLCSGEARRMEVLAQRMRQERLFRYVRVADRPPIHHAPTARRSPPPLTIPLVR